MAPTKQRVRGRKYVRNNDNRNSFKDSCPEKNKTTTTKTKQGDHNLGLFLITKYSKIAFIEDSLLSSIHDQFNINLWQRNNKNIYV